MFPSIVSGTIGKLVHVLRPVVEEHEQTHEPKRKTKLMVGCAKENQQYKKHVIHRLVHVSSQSLPDIINSDCGYFSCKIIVLFLSLERFFLNLAIHCMWNDWVLGECSKQCGTGARTNTRTKKVVEKDGGTCTGQPTEEEECKIKECPGMLLDADYNLYITRKNASSF